MRVVAGSVLLVRFVAPVAAFGYLAVLTRGDNTALDWLLVAVSSGLTLVGGRWPFSVAVGQSLLLVLVGLLLRLSPQPAKEFAEPSGGWLSASTAQPIQLLVALAVLELAVRQPLSRAVVGAVIAAVAQVGTSLLQGPPADIGVTFYRLGFTAVAPLLLGAYVREAVHRFRQAQLAAEMAERRRLDAELAARLGERRAIAREIHDLVAHHVASIALRTAVARRAVPDLDPRIVAVLTEVHQAATATLGDLRTLITVLRDPERVSEHHEPIALGAALAQTLAQNRATGIEIAADLDPRLDGLDQLRAVAVLRTVQEALTNVRKHAGDGATVTMTADVVDDRVELKIVDRGGDRRGLPGIPGSGTGLIGLAERFTVLGGTFDAGAADGGWTVRAGLPIGEPAPLMGLSKPADGE